MSTCNVDHRYQIILFHFTLDLGILDWMIVLGNALLPIIAQGIHVKAAPQLLVLLDCIERTAL